jgi:hypothetical protein
LQLREGGKCCDFGCFRVVSLQYFCELFKLQYTLLSVPKCVVRQDQLKMPFSLCVTQKNKLKQQRESPQQRTNEKEAAANADTKKRWEKIIKGNVGELFA